ncbi:Protein yipf5 [Tyrophagus putrescentiae]|nr:Protein yipf5 [Tyrophagus putrescentiae]
MNSYSDNKNQSDFWSNQTYDFGSFDYNKAGEQSNYSGSFYPQQPAGFAPPANAAIPGAYDTYGNGDPTLILLDLWCLALLSAVSYYSREKVHFSYIYGFGVLGCALIYCLLVLMSPPNITFTAVCTVSILGYCLLPMVFLSAIAIFVSLNTMLGMSVAMLVILWCALSASKLFVTALSMHNQQALVAYPCILFYGVFALLALF